MKVGQNVLPWRHRPLPELVRLAWPITVSMLSYSVMTLVDTLFVGQLGATALAGVSLGGVATFTVLCFGIGALKGVNVLTSQEVGAHGREAARVWLSIGLAVALFLGALAWVVGFSLSPLLERLATSEAMAEATLAYFGTRLWGAPLVLIFVAVREYRYGLSDTRSAMAASVVANIANVFLDWLFVMHLDFGVSGAALASVVGAALQLCTIVWVVGPRLLLRDALHGRFRRSKVRQLVQVGVPTGLQFLLEVGSFSVLTAIIATFGEVHLAAHQIALQVLHFSFLPTMAVADAAAVLAGQAVGAGQFRAVRKVSAVALKLGAGYIAFCGIILVTFANVIADAFTDEAELIGLATTLLRLAALLQVPDGLGIVLRGILRGTGDVRFAAVAGVVGSWLTTPPLAYLLGAQAGWGAVGGWVALTIDLTLVGSLFALRLAWGGWVNPARRLRLAAR